MKRITTLCLLATSIVAAHAESFTDVARVRSATPEYERTNTPRKECSSEWVRETREVPAQRQYGGAVIGGLAGALIGNQVGKGHGREAATAVGAVVGALAGDNIDNRDRGGYTEEVPREIKRCRTVEDWQRRLVGYRVEYEYRGQQYSTIMSENPGRTMQVRVSVEPVN
ncbi:glycine zipper 2TM domain-containing protein [Chitinimonas sp. PSY-7]|uniref:glycine zipper 2TM domain-containing protein n=1 Tax=Chitinimonas sp. PSY-7 TaxID=3459088 RepID=UPI00404038DE